MEGLMQPVTGATNTTNNLQLGANNTPNNHQINNSIQGKDIWIMNKLKADIL